MKIWSKRNCISTMKEWGNLAVFRINSIYPWKTKRFITKYYKMRKIPESCFKKHFYAKFTTKDEIMFCTAPVPTPCVHTIHMKICSWVHLSVAINYLNGFQILVLCFCGFFTILTAKRLRPDRLDCCGYWMSCLDVVSVITELNFGPRWSKVQAAITSVVWR